MQRHSYGRQLGRIADAVEAIVEAQPPDGPLDERIEAFLGMQHEIQDIKTAEALHRFERLASDAASLKASNSRAYERLRNQLRVAFDL